MDTKDEKGLVKIIERLIFQRRKFAYQKQHLRRGVTEYLRSLDLKDPNVRKSVSSLLVGMKRSAQSENKNWLADDLLAQLSDDKVVQLKL